MKSLGTLLFLFLLLPLPVLPTSSAQEINNDCQPQFIVFAMTVSKQTPSRVF